MNINISKGPDGLTDKMTFAILCQIILNLRGSHTPLVLNNTSCYLRNNRQTGIRKYHPVSKGTPKYQKVASLPARQPPALPSGTKRNDFVPKRNGLVPPVHQQSTQATLNYGLRVHRRNPPTRLCSPASWNGTKRNGGTFRNGTTARSTSPPNSKPPSPPWRKGIKL